MADIRVVLEPPGSAEAEKMGVWTAETCRAVRRVLDEMELILEVEICGKLMGHPEPVHRDPTTEGPAWRGP